MALTRTQQEIVNQYLHNIDVENPGHRSDNHITAGEMLQAGLVPDNGSTDIEFQHRTPPNRDGSFEADDSVLINHNAFYRRIMNEFGLNVQDAQAAVRASGYIIDDVRIHDLYNNHLLNDATCQQLPDHRIRITPTQGI